MRSTPPSTALRSLTLLSLLALNSLPGPAGVAAAVQKLTIDDGGANPPVQGLTYYPALGTPGVWTNQTNAPEFIQTTVHTSYTPGSGATVVFTGTGIQFVGTQNVDHGKLSFILDGQLSVVEGQSPNGSFIPNTTQFSASSLDQSAKHMLTIINAEDVAHAADYDAWIVTMDPSQPTPAADAGTFVAPQGSPANLTVQDGSSMIEYYPSDGTSWGQATGNSYLNGGVHTCKADGAGATIRFNGSAIYFVSTLSPAGGPFVVVLDGAISPMMGAFSSVTTYQQVLWSAKGLNETMEHTATVVMIGSGVDGVQRNLDVDGFVITASGATASDTATATSAAPAVGRGWAAARTLVAAAALASVLLLL